MLEQFREFANKRIVKLLFALFLVVPFGLFGIDFYFRTPVGGDTLASVGRARIGQQEFDQALRTQTENYRRQLRGQFDPAIMDNPEVRRAVLDGLVSQRLLTIGAERAGIRMGDKQLAEKIYSEPFFQVEGRFNRERYEQIAKAEGITPAGLDERLRQNFREQQFRGGITDTTIVPRSMLDNFIRLSGQSREVSVVNLVPDAYVPRVKIEPAKVKEYYAAHPLEFTVPEQVRVEYVELSLDTLAARASVSPDEVKAVYEQDLKAGKYGTPEERRASHILVSVPASASDDAKKAAEARANEIAERVRKNPNAFADVARKESQDPGSAAQGGDLGFFPRNGTMVKPFEDAVFSAKKGEVVGPVRSDFGYHVIRVTDIRPAKVRSLAEATPEIEANLKKAKAQNGFADSVEQLNNIVYEQPSSLKPAADKLGLTVQASPWFAKGAAPTAALGNAKLQAEIFSDSSIKAQRNTTAIEVAPNTFIAAHVVEHKPAELRAFDAVKADIERRLVREEALRLARADGEAKLKELQEGKDAGLKWPAPLAVSRQKTGGLFPQVMDKVFRIDAKKVPAYTGVETPFGYSIVKVSKVIDEEKVDDAPRQALAGRLRQAVADEELESTLASIRERVGVSVKKGALDPKQNPQQQ